MNINIKPAVKKPKGVPVQTLGSMKPTPLTQVMDKHRIARQKHITAKPNT